MTVRIIRGQGPDACPWGYWALYENKQYNESEPADILISDTSVWNLKDVGFNDRASSYVNRTRYTISLYDDAGYEGRERGVGSGSQYHHVIHERTTRPYLFSDEEVGDMNDAVSSVRLREPALEAATFPAGLYTLVNGGSGKALEVADGALENGGNIQQWEFNQSAAQQWQLDPLGDGEYTLTNKVSGKRMDVAGNDSDKRENGANVHQWAAFDHDSQKWRIRLRPSMGNYTLTNVFNGKALDVADGSTANGANVQQYDHNDTDAQKWTIRPVSRNPAAGTYTLTNVGSEKALDAVNTTVEGGGAVVQWSRHGHPNQQWTLAEVTDGVFTLTSVYSGKVLDVTGGSKDNGAPLQQWAGNGSPAQQWKLTEAGEGIYRLQCIGSGKFLDVAANSTDDGAIVHQWDANDYNSQKWRLTPVG
ncbi:RICIN domain-containing protein [Streptomyces sp. NBC_01304]|uniref:RICIN domain-containing protein n=1 Tax=Streptomyces sp. NBC_01304 TaxID=2903818 RepID=UPI002E0DED5D|nr:RICIN domain-containing protein [Streptomyces sp. NBC_01304]